ncbi:MAG TPA: hypothetical protein ENI11_03570 [Actinobacteria bacterium]|nr:hypothetical protein [Actinomycetota bacterium]
MAIQKGDIIDEVKKSEESCRVAIKVLDGGAGFESVNCCGLELTDAEKTDSVDSSVDRFAGDKAKPGIIIDESKNHPNACGLKVEIVGGGKGFSSISCCGNELTIDNDAV